MKAHLALAASLVLALAAACGGTTIAPGGDACPGQPAACSDGCGGTYAPDCSDGQWVCAATTGECAADASSDASCPDTPIHCANPCGLGAECIDGRWVCPDTTCPADAGYPDASTGGDATSTAFACGSETCDSTTQFCMESGGGVQLPDGGSNFSETCHALPTQCEPSPTCACVIGAMNGGCGCSSAGNDVTVECFVP